jgi:membrane protein DedA with SNARE-associated domain
MSFELFSLDQIQELAQQYGYWAVLIGVLLENAGLPVPGETLVLVAGFLAGSEDLNYWWVLGIAATSAAVGGSLGYWIGFYGGWSLLLRLGKLLRLQEVQLLELKERFGYNAARAVFLGRFVAFLRVFVGPMAGIAGMPFGKFLVYNCAGAVLWASVMVTLAFFAGQLISLEELIAWASKLGLLALGLIIAGTVLLVWLETRKKQAA